jgi:hypothetical protein
MKKFIVKLCIIGSLIMFPLLTVNLFAQPMPPAGGHSQTGNQPAGAPLDGGLSILVLMAAAYGGGKIHINRKKGKEEKK